MHSFALLDGTDKSKINAELKDGSLEVQLPENEEAELKALEAKVVA